MPSPEGSFSAEVGLCSIYGGGWVSPLFSNVAKNTGLEWFLGDGTKLPCFYSGLLSLGITCVSLRLVFILGFGSQSC